MLGLLFYIENRRLYVGILAYSRERYFFINPSGNISWESIVIAVAKASHKAPVMGACWISAMDRLYSTDAVTAGNIDFCAFICSDHKPCISW